MHVPAECQHLLARRRVPDFHGAIRAARGQLVAQRVEGHTRDLLAVAVERMQLLAVDGVPDLDGAVGAGRGQPISIGAEGHTGRAVGVPP